MPIDRRPLKTERLVLEPLGPEHIDHMWTACETSLPELRPWLSWTANASREDMGEFIAGAPDAWAQGREMGFAIREEARVIGTISVRQLNPRLPHGELGYWLASDRAGNGLTTEAARAVRDLAFDVLGHNRLQLRAGTTNAASIRVAEKIGFQREGLMRMGAGGAPGPYDCYLYGMLASDPRL